MRRAWQRAALLVAWLACGAVAAATPAEEHQRGLTAFQRGDVVTAMSALRIAARAGHAPAQALLGFILDRADYSDEAAQSYRDAAAQDDADGHAGLASLYLSGRGVAKDEKQALQHFSKAADLGHATSIETVATAYLGKRFGLEPEGRDAAGAVAAWRRAAERGHAPSAEALARAYQGGLNGVAADPAVAANWLARAAALRKPAPAAAKAAK